MVLPGDGGARIVLCADGGRLRAGTGRLNLPRGGSCYLSAADGVVTASGPASLFIAGDRVRPGRIAPVLRREHR